MQQSERKTPVPGDVRVNAAGSAQLQVACLKEEGVEQEDIQGTNASASAAAGSKKDDDQDKSLSLEDIKM